METDACNLLKLLFSQILMKMKFIFSLAHKNIEKKLEYFWKQISVNNMHETRNAVIIKGTLPNELSNYVAYGGISIGTRKALKKYRMRC